MVLYILFYDDILFHSSTSYRKTRVVVIVKGLQVNKQLTSFLKLFCLEKLYIII